MKNLKLFVVGPYGAGKTTFIETISQIGAVRVDLDWEEDKAHRSVAMDFGRLTLSESLVIYFFAHPVGLRLDKTLDHLAQQGLSLTELGFIVMIDSVHPDNDGADKHILNIIMSNRERENNHYLNYIQGFHRPCVVALSRQDLPTARTPAQMHTALQGTDDIKVLGYQRNDPTTAKRVVLGLLELMPDNDAAQQAIVDLRAQIEGE